MIPTDIDRAAPVVVRLERTISVPLDRVWRFHLGVADWPSWQSDIKSASLDGDVAPGGSFTWTTAGLDEPIVSTIYAVVPHDTTLWGGPSAGIVGIHRWSFTEETGATHVVTEESWAGPPVASNPESAKQMLEASLDRWLSYLANAAERTMSK